MRDAFRGDRLEALRHIYGLTQAELGQRIGLKQSYLSRLERADTSLPEEVAVAASEAFGEPLTFFTIAPDAVTLGPAAFRRKASMKAAERDRVNSLYREASRVFASVSEMTGYREFEGVVGTELTDPERAATAVRTELGLMPDQPVRNVTRLLERIGVGVVTELDDEQHAHELSDISGITMPTRKNRRPVVATMSIGRGDVQRLTLAHELGHLILDREAATISCSTRSPQERAAFALGAALLLPRQVLEKRIGESSTLRDFLEVKAEYGISVSAMVMRAQQLGIVSPTRARTLQIQHSSRGWRDNEPVEVTVESPMLLRQALSKAYPTSTFARASHDLGVAPDRLRRWSGETAHESEPGNVTELKPRHVRHASGRSSALSGSP